MKILITGCAGFIGTNAVAHYVGQGHNVLGIDNLSREGTEDNLMFLRDRYVFDFRKVDITSFDFSHLPEVDVVIHLAAQVGVQSSIEDPLNDLNQNVFGTFKVLEYARHHSKKPIVLFASTNKVYGELKTTVPVSEDVALDFHTPYGVSKGSAEQYVLDYSRIYGIPSVVFRQSCIYGEHQLGKEEQGWVAWFLIADKLRQTLTIYGDGNQVRDVLHVEDLLRAYDLAIKNIDKVSGMAFNTGGGEENTLSLNELVNKAEISVPIIYTDWRPSDQKYYVSDITRLKKVLKWAPKIRVNQGLTRLKEWINQRYQ